MYTTRTLAALFAVALLVVAGCGGGGDEFTLPPSAGGGAAGGGGPAYDPSTATGTITGSILFEGTPADLAETARGRVWSSPRPVPDARMSWRTATGRYRVVADHVDDAEAAEPTIEDAYLLLVGQRALADEEAA